MFVCYHGRNNVGIMAPSYPPKKTKKKGKKFMAMY